MLIAELRQRFQSEIRIPNSVFDRFLIDYTLSLTIHSSRASSAGRYTMVIILSA